MAPHLLFFAVETIGVFSVLVLGLHVLVSSPSRYNAQLLALMCFNSACGRLLARQEYGFWIPEP